ncbi:class I SAM-dependent methyltransferase [Poriferisphaera sp. WC338]|uniref:class I SAM-dependent methyltransferase n=1 Tax=Poriferisphaera sp. WC338 TaxID=3425129 RepID=UPI003D81851A
MSEKYLEPYREAADKHGSDFEVTLWANRQTQEVRFDVFMEMCYLGGKRILDAGCSRGDFGAYLLKKGIGGWHKKGGYVGVDGLEEVIAYAKEREIFAGSEAEFVCGDLVADPEVMRVGEPQVVVISGTLNTMSDAEVYKVLEGAWAGASETLLFNFLSDQVAKGTPKQGWPARRLPTLDLLRWAFEKTPLVNMRQDYFEHGHDATIMMVKAKQAK